MKLNPFDDQLKDAKQRASRTRGIVETFSRQIAWYERTDLSHLLNYRNELQSKLHFQFQACTRARGRVQPIEETISELSEAIKSLWNPRNWFDSRQRELRDRVATAKTSLKSAKQDLSTAEALMQGLQQQMHLVTEEIKKYKSFDLDEKMKNRTPFVDKLSRQVREVERIAVQKQKVDAALAPIVKQIVALEKMKSEAATVKLQAQSLDEELSRADTSYERAMTHQRCEDKFGTGSPRKLITRKDSEVRRLDRDLEKLSKRARIVAANAARNIKKLILDGNNLCYQGDTFIGLAALQSLAPSLTTDYEVVVVFDASIRRALGCSDSDIRNSFGDHIQVHVVASSITADETVLDLAESTKTAFIVSNDRFAEFGEKTAVQDARIIRHEIVSGQIFIHDLGIAENFEQ